jgi:ribosomal subunit interface protein
MRVLIHGKGFDITPGLKAYVGEHLEDHILRFYDDAAAQLDVQFIDNNGPKGGADKEVHLTFYMPGSRVLHVEERTEDPYRSLDLARARLVRRIHGELDRMRRRTGHPLSRPLGRTAAASERQISTREDEPEASPPTVHVDLPVEG